MSLESPNIKAVRPDAAGGRSEPVPGCANSSFLFRHSGPIQAANKSRADQPPTDRRSGVVPSTVAG